MKVLIRNCLSLVIPFRYAKLYQKTLAELMVEDTKYCTSILSRFFWVSAFFFFWGHNNRQGGSTHLGFRDLVMFTVMRKKFMDRQEYTFNLSLISYPYKFAIIVSKAFSFFWLFLYYLNFNFVITARSTKVRPLLINSHSFAWLIQWERKDR